MVDTILTVLGLLSGVALFLYGMSVMGEGLKQVAGNKLELILYKLTSTPLKGLLLGAAVTAVIQSSSATSVMVVGFVNSGLMKLSQAIGIIMGANIGTSITGWIICLSYIDGQAGLASLLSTTTISGVVAIIGIILRMFVKKDKYHALGNIMLGFAVLMVGMQMMSGAVAPLSESPAFTGFLTSFRNPVLGILFGITLTAVLQSASAAVGILQALSITGAITFSSALPMCMGIGIGAATPVLLSSIGTGVNARRTALVYLLNDVFAMLIGSTLFYSANGLFHFPFYTMVLDPFSIAMLNTVYRLLTMLILLPFTHGVEKLTKMLVKDHPDDEDDEDTDTLDLLENRFLDYPALALSQCKKAMDSMADNVVKNLMRALNLYDHFEPDTYKKIGVKEKRIDKYQDKLDTYLMQLLSRELSTAQSVQASKYLHVIPDLERIGDYGYEMAKVAKSQAEDNAYFTDISRKELDVMKEAVIDIVDMTLDSFEQDDLRMAQGVEPLRHYISQMASHLRHRRINRMKDTQEAVEQGFDYNELVNDMERIADHCSNIAIYVIETSRREADTHAYVKRLKKEAAAEYQRYMDIYKHKYIY